MTKVLAVGGMLVLTLAACTDEALEEGESETSQAICGHGNGGHGGHGGHGGMGDLPNNVPMPNRSGFATTVSTDGRIDLDNEFFQDLGSNGRRCVSCHLPTAGWGITPEQVQDVFNATRGGELHDQLGLGAIFRTNDGANSPEADVSTFAKRKKAYSMLLNHGVIRVSMPIPAGAEFELAHADDPYHHSTAADVSMFRRPLPSTNLLDLATVMWDGRETFAGESIHFDLSDQANGATTGHAQGDPLDDDQRESIVAFETSLTTAQEYDNKAGDLDRHGAHGGVDALQDQEFHIGINDNFGDCIDPDNTGCRVVGAPLGSGTRGAPFNPKAFNIYDGWTNDHDNDRKSVARGQKLFNTRTINISGVSGLNDEAAFGNPANVVGSCTTCHDAPNVGDHSVVAPLNIGLVDESRRSPDFPLYTLRCSSVGVANGVCSPGQTVKVTDPGRAMISGKWKHIGRFKGPILRGLAARAPYFHNGFAKDLDAAVDFYNDRFQMHLTNQEHKDLVNFLRTL